MPRGDGTGPEGKGPRTGRGLGHCTEDGVPSYKRKLDRESDKIIYKD